MILSIQGYSHKKNKSPMVAAAIAGYLSMFKNERTLIIQLINNDLDSLERIFLNIENTDNTFHSSSKEFVVSIVEEGIDGLLGVINNQKVTNNLLSNYVRTVQTAQNKNGAIVKTLLDIIPISRNSNFVSNLDTKGELLQMLITAAAGDNMYEHVIILMDDSNSRVKEIVNEICDKKICCITQNAREKIPQNDVDAFFVITDYESDSAYTLSKIAKTIMVSDNLYKIERNVPVLDAIREGTLYSLMKSMKDMPKADSKQIWLNDVVEIINALNEEIFQKSAFPKRLSVKERVFHVYAEPRDKEDIVEEEKKGLLRKLRK